MALHYFDVDVARRCGVNAAILLSDIQYWCERSKGDPAHLREGRVWMWSSLDEFARRHPYMSFSQVRFALKQLRQNEMVLTLRNSGNSTIWYAPSDVSCVAPEVSCVAPEVSCVAPHVSCVAPHVSCVAHAGVTHDKPTTIHYRDTLENTIETNRDNVGGNRYVSPPNVVVRGEMENITHPTIDQVREYARAAGLRVDAEAFVRANEATGWKDTQGRPIRNWKLWLQGYAAKHPASVGEEWQGHKLEFI